MQCLCKDIVRIKQSRRLSQTIETRESPAYGSWPQGKELPYLLHNFSPGQFHSLSRLQHLFRKVYGSNDLISNRSIFCIFRKTYSHSIYQTISIFKKQQMLVLPMKEYISGSTSGIDWMDSTKLSRETSHIASLTEVKNNDLLQASKYN